MNEKEQEHPSRTKTLRNKMWHFDRLGFMSLLFFVNGAADTVDGTGHRMFSGSTDKTRSVLSSGKKNVFENGCLKVMSERYQKNGSSSLSEGNISKAYESRTCNSDDELTGNMDCRELLFDNYKEIRIGPGDWDECKIFHTQQPFALRVKFTYQFL